MKSLFKYYLNSFYYKDYNEGNNGIPKITDNINVKTFHEDNEYVPIHLLDFTKISSVFSVYNNFKDFMESSYDKNVDLNFYKKTYFDIANSVILDENKIFENMRFHNYVGYGQRIYNKSIIEDSLISNKNVVFYRLGSYKYGIGNHFVLAPNETSNTSLKILSALCIKKEDIEYFKYCIIFDVDFPTNKLYIFRDLDQYNKSKKGNFGKYLHNCFNELYCEIPENNIFYRNNIIEYFFKHKTFPNFKTVSERKTFFNTVFINSKNILSSIGIDKDKFKNCIKLELKNNNNLYLPANYRSVSNIHDSVKIKNTYNNINLRTTNIIMRTINIKKSELALLVGLGQNITQIANNLNIDESDLKELMIKCGLIKSKKTLKPYILNIEVDV